MESRCLEASTAGDGRAEASRGPLVSAFGW
jgi:hypothetical protein